MEKSNTVPLTGSGPRGLVADSMIDGDVPNSDLGRLKKNGVSKKELLGGV
jgi:hypothetical protein